MATKILSAVNDVARLAKLTADANEANALRELDLAAKKELISIAGAVNAAAAKGITEISYKLSNAITGLAALNLTYAIELIEADMTEAEYEFEQKKVNDKITGYDISWTEHAANFNELASALENNDRVVLTLASDTEVTGSFVIPANKTVIVDLNADIINTNATGGNATVPGQAAFVADGGTLILRGDGEISGAPQAVIANNGGTVIIESGNYTTTAGAEVIRADHGSEVIINGGTFNGQEFAVRPYSGSTVTINGGEFNTIDNCVIGTNGTVDPVKGDWGHNTITIKNAVLNGEITSTNWGACGIYAANSDTITVEDTIINVHNGCGICQRAGNVVVKSGVEINLTVDEGFTGGWVGDKQRVVGLDGIAYLPADNYPGAASGMSLTVEDGVTINAIDHAIYTDPEDAEVNIGIGNYTPVYPTPVEEEPVVEEPVEPETPTEEPTEPETPSSEPEE